LKIRLALVDDHPLVVDGLTAGLATVSDLELVETAATIDMARDVLRRDDVDVVLLEVRLQGGNGLQILADRMPRTQPSVLVLSSFTSSQYIAAARRFGASGFLLKTIPLSELVEGIRAVAAGETLFTSQQRATRFVELTSRERDILALAMEGLTNKEIGDRVGTSKKSVEAHLSGIFNRYQIRGGRVELSLRAAAEGWLEITAPIGRRRARHTVDGDNGEERPKT
jgi:DNA-binding NarL/FixJ family response regulator